jgi:drug/metabolite transporter (DMT)-like permease
MSDEPNRDTRGTVWDWPALLAVMGVLLAVFAGSKGSGAGVLLGLVLAAFGTVTVLARRGAFSPRRD